MKSTSSMEFIDTALFESSSFELSYKDPLQKWVIRKHFLKLFQDFPCFIPSTNKFDHFDGTSMNLLNVNGFLHVSDFLPDVPLIIWLHENYPLVSPMIFIPSNPDCPIRENHPFVDPSGVVTTPYLLDWDQKKSNLCDLVHNLADLFQLEHPSLPKTTLKATIQDDLDAKFYDDLDVKETIIDDLVRKISDDLAALDVQVQNDIERESNTQVKLKERGDVIDGNISILKNERDNLEKSVAEVEEYNDKLSDWLRNTQNASSTADVQIVGAKSKMMVECKAASKALDDVLYALDEALEQGVISLDVYMKQVRVVAREQFFHRAMFFELKTSSS
ncbi:protein ELC-like [Chenopodium quinoa]|uniref:protein ELC-like n=1 Tax=Chenopodium quinoa TaxID=63459 RepID=UPI000B790798|nr:protein ELC-like [Chenopodium quinoa]